jgi:hypothetical protein
MTWRGPTGTAEAGMILEGLDRGPKPLSDLPFKHFSQKPDRKEAARNLTPGASQLDLGDLFDYFMN